MTCGNLPISVTGPNPIRVGNNLLLSCNESPYWAHTVRVGFTALNTGKWRNSIVDYNAYLILVTRVTREYCQSEFRELLLIAGPERNLHWNCTLVEKGAS